MPSYQFVLCLGDSITFGARAAAGWPEYAAAKLNESPTPVFLVHNRGVNSRTVLELLRDLPAALALVPKREPGAGGPPYIVTVLVGANDAKVGTPPAVFGMVYGQVLDQLMVPEGQRRVLCIATPEFLPGLGYVPYGVSPAERVKDLNAAAKAAAQKRGALWVELQGLEPTHFADSVHPNTEGQQFIGWQLAAAIKGL